MHTIAICIYCIIYLDYKEELTGEMYTETNQISYFRLRSIELPSWEWLYAGIVSKLLDSTPIEERCPLDSTPIGERCPLDSTPIEERCPLDSTPIEERCPHVSTPIEERFGIVFKHSPSDEEL